MDILAKGMEQGGFFMWPILVCAVFGVSIGLERFFFIFFRASINAAAFMAQIQRLVLDDDVEGAVRLCNAEPSAALPRVIKAALVREARPEAEMRDAVEELSLEVYPEINRRLSFLPMIANVSTLLGLLGTIQGLIQAFKAVGEASAEARSQALSSGIAVAMYTTFFGLFVAIPVIVSHGIVAARANALLDEIDQYGLKVMNLLNATRRSAPLSGGSPVLPFPG